jgi:hypothetical protein
MRRGLITFLLVAGGLAAGATTAAASTSQSMVFEAPRELRSGNDALIGETLGEIQGFGVNWIRYVLYWRDVAPSVDSSTAPSFDETDPAGYNWTRPDAAIRAAKARGMKVILTVSAPAPKWASANRRSYTYKPSAARFERFMTAVGRHYAGEISKYSIWNEPNHPNFLTPQYVNGKPYSPRLYRGLFFAADRGLRAAGEGGVPLLAGETAPRGGSRVVRPLAFLRGALCLSSSYRRGRGCKAAPVDGWAHHPYTTSGGPWVRPRYQDDVTIGVLSRLTSALDRAARAGVVKRGLGIYLTEFGIQSEPDPYAGVSYTKQAEYRSIAEQIAYRNGRVRTFSQYLMRDDEPRAGPASQRYAGFESGLRRSSGGAKLAYAGFRLPLVADRRSGSTHVALWGLVRPAGSTRVTVQLRRKGSKTWKRLKSDSTNSRGYWSTTTTAWRSGTWFRVAWTDASGHTAYGPPTRAY